MKYGCILADPPWPYDNMRDHDPKMGGYRYNPMLLEDIYSLPVRRICDENCALFLWATFPKLREALTTIEKWGFKYITVAFVWVKLNPNGQGIYSGLGSYTSANAEIVLLGRIGSIKRCSWNVKQIILAPRGKHSDKPIEVHKRIERLMGDVPKLELFARRNTSNWTCIGLDLTGRDIKQDLDLLDESSR